MRAIVLDHFGGLDSLVIKEIPEPEPEPGKVVIQIKALGSAARLVAPPVDHGTQAAVADRKRVDPLVCRVRVPEGESVGSGVGGLSDAEAARERNRSNDA